ncbi:MAG: CRISPR-associated endonuclease Cas1, partial [Rectinemataceae bacterium]|nr:CRISPR-associated endonuclease Cas1 [Rectinemataceae bacterium]
QEQGACIGKDGDGFKVTKGRVELGSVRLVDISQLVICGNISISAQALHLCAEAGVPVVHLSMGNWFYGITQGFVLKNAFDRAAQFAVAADPARCLALAKCFMNAKCQNQRTLLRRNTRDSEDRVLDEMAKLIASIETAPNLQTLLGIEGGLAAKYFSNFGRMIKTREGMEAFDWGSRNRRPPRDPLNSMLSFGYALLAKECTVALASVGLDPFWGFYHQPRHGRPSLALDLMEEFRPLIVDSAVLSAVNTGMVAIHDFETGSNGCLMTSSCRKSFIKAYESRLDQMFTHPVFDYRCSWRRVIFMQAQLLGRFLRGELRTYQGVTTR